MRVVGGDDGPLGSASGLPSRIEDATAEAVAVAAPRADGDGWLPAEGEEFELVWPSPRGLQVYPVRLVDSGRDGVALWWCALAGDVVLRQRRAHVRAQTLVRWPVRVVLEWDDPEPGSAEGVLVDLSEGGLRARVTGWCGGDDVPVAISLVLAEGAADEMEGGRSGAVLSQHELRGTALREVASGAAPSGAVDVGVQFAAPVAPADDLRALVFAWQRAERRAANG